MELHQFEIIIDILSQIIARLPTPEPELKFNDLETVLAYHRGKIEQAIAMRQKFDAELKRL